MRGERTIYRSLENDVVCGLPLCQTNTKGATESFRPTRRTNGQSPPPLSWRELAEQS